jgi:hypothetical protein
MSHNPRRLRLAMTFLFGATSLAPLARADCLFNPAASGEPTLQVALGQLLAPAPDVVTTCLAEGTGAGGDAHWTSVGQTSATILLEIAGFANVNSFGLYDLANPQNRLQIFSGPSDSGARAQLSFHANGTIAVSYGGHDARRARFSSDAFGFYLLTGEGRTLLSDSTLNQGGVDRMYAYRGNGSQFISGSILDDGDPDNDTFGATDAILAYEDLLNGDNDFQDFVVLVRGIQPIPLPAGLWLLGSALAALRLSAGLRLPREFPS